MLCGGCLRTRRNDTRRSYEDAAGTGLERLPRLRASDAFIGQPVEQQRAVGAVELRRMKAVREMKGDLRAGSRPVWTGETLCLPTIGATKNAGINHG